MGLTDITPDSPKKRRLWVLVAIGATLLAVPLVVWLSRLALAEHVVRNYCADRGLVCNLSISELDLNHVSVSSISIARQNVDPLRIEDLEITMDWPSLFQPLITSVHARRPELVVDARGGSVSVDIIDALGSESNGEPGASLPPFTIEEGQLTILTDAGPVKGVVSTSGSIGREIQSSVVILPASLALNGYELELEGGLAQFVLAKSRISGDLNLNLSKAELEGVTARNISLTASIDPMDDGIYQADWRVEAEQLAHDFLTASGFLSQGKAELEFEGEPRLETAKVRRFEANATSETLIAANKSLNSTELIFDFAADGEKLVGDMSFTSEAFIFDEILTGRGIVLTGDVSLASRALTSPSGSFSGALSLKQASVPEPFREKILSPVSLPDPLNLHGEAVRQVLDNLLAEFGTGIELDADFNLAQSEFSAKAVRPAIIKSNKDDITLSLVPRDGETWLTVRGTDFGLNGGVTLKAPGEGLQLSVQNAKFDKNLSVPDLSLSARGINLSNWKVGARSFAADLATLSFQLENGQSRAEADGLVRYSGAAFGVDFDNLTIGGRFSGLRAATDWNVRLNGKNCFNVGFGEVRISDVAAGPLQTEACVHEGRLFGRKALPGGQRRLVGNLTFDKLGIPVRRADMKGEFTLFSPEIDWRYDRVFGVTVESPEATAFFRQTGSANSPGTLNRLRMGRFLAGLTSEPGRTDLHLNIKDGKLDMPDLPVAMAFTEWDAGGPLTDKGPLLDWSILGLQVEDSKNKAANALFQPVMTSGNGTLNADGIVYRGRLRLAEQDADFGRLDVQHNFSSSSGSLTLVDGQIDFAPSVLKSHDVSERLRGLLVNASGSVRPEVEVSWSGDLMTSGARLVFENLSFSTFRLGDIRRVSGTLELSDLFDPRTPPGQTFTLGELKLSPSISLLDGELSIQVVSVNEFRLERAVWPFVGGELSVDPTLWSLNAASQNLTIRAEKWSLNRLLNLFDISDLKIYGTVSGTFPIEIIGADIFLRGARLEGIDNGQIQYTGETGERAGEANEYARMAFDALRNFEYELLSLVANGNLLGEVLLELALSGQNPNVLDGQVFNLNITLQSKLAGLLRGMNYATSAQATRDAVVELVRQRQTDKED